MGTIVQLFMLLLTIAILVAWIMSISLIINAIKAKGYEQITVGTLWFIGLFASPIVLGLYAVALPDKRGTTDKPAS